MKEMTLAEGIKLVLEQGMNNKLDKGVLTAIGTTNVEGFAEKMHQEKNDEYAVLHNANDEAVREVLKNEVIKTVFLYDYEGTANEARKLIWEYTEKNIVVVLALSTEINHRLPMMADFRHTPYEQEASVIVGITDAGIVRLKNRFGYTGGVSFKEILEVN